MNWIKDKIEIRFWRFAIWLIRRGYGANCETSDLEDFEFNGLDAMRVRGWRDVFAPGRCASCRAREAIDWIQKHIELIEY